MEILSTLEFVSETSTSATVGRVATVVVAVVLLVIGVRFLAVPASAATAFGVPSDRANAYLTVKGIRDLTSGVLLAIVAATLDAHALGWFVLAACLTPLGDAWVVARAGGSRVLAYGMHGGTAVAAAVIAVVLILS